MSNDSRFGKKGIIFGTSMRLSVNIDIKKEQILILGKDLTAELNDTTLTPEREYSITFTEQKKKSCLSLHQNGNNGGAVIYLLKKHINLKQNIQGLMQLHYAYKTFQRVFWLIT